MPPQLITPAMCVSVQLCTEVDPQIMIETKSCALEEKQRLRNVCRRFLMSKNSNRPSYLVTPYRAYMAQKGTTRACKD